MFKPYLKKNIERTKLHGEEATAPASDGSAAAPGSAALHGPGCGGGAGGGGGVAPREEDEARREGVGSLSSFSMFLKK